MPRKFQSERTVKFKRIYHAPREPGGVGYTTQYQTEDGRFVVYRYHNRGGGGWQARALDGSEPFISASFGKIHKSSIYNGDTLADCRNEIADAIDCD